MKANEYDIIIAGGGAAGLMLVHHLLHSILAESKILIIEKEKKDQNDRTWCFWTKDKTGFEDILYKNWEKVIFKNNSTTKTLHLSPYKYQMIRGIDFYQFVKKEISERENVTWVNEELKSLDSQNNFVFATTDKQTFRGKTAFNSIPIKKPANISSRKNYLLQHFKGYVIKTVENNFDPTTPFLMDFRVDQQGETRFGYVLPFSENEALVEFTIFSENLLTEEAYKILLENYIRHQLDINDYRIIDEEFGVIPMTDIDLPEKNDPNIYNVGTRGGMTKASTGYTFKNIMDECKGLVQKLEKGRIDSISNNKKFRFFDSVFLHVLEKNLHPADKIFSDLFLKNDPRLILKFLNEKTSLREDIGILSSLPTIPFLKGAMYTIFSTGTKNLSTDF